MVQIQRSSSYDTYVKYLIFSFVKVFRGNKDNGIHKIRSQNFMVKIACLNICRC
jgi:hypothetical protein